jgi:quinohemoprotein ethanol dehydrogenase
VIDRGPVPEPPAQTADAATIAHGADVFSANCRACHTQVPGAVAPDLTRMAAATHAEFEDIVLHGNRRDRGMPQWDDLLNEEDAKAIHAYIISFSWDAYRAQQEQTN